MNTPYMIQDPVDELLKADAAALRDDYIDDAGFTLRVMDALPARRAISPMLRFGIPMAFALLAALMTALFAGGGNFMIDAAMDIVTSTMTGTVMAFGVILGLMMVVSVAAVSGER